MKLHRNKLKNKILIYLVGLPLLIFIVFPFYWILVTSFKPASDIVSSSPTLFPQTLTFENYITAFVKNDIGKYFFNTVKVAVSATIVSTLIASAMAYAITRLQFKGRKALHTATGMTQAFPKIVMMIPLFFLCNTLGVYNKLSSLFIIYVATETPIAVMLICNHLSDISTEYSEAASIDGAGFLQTMIKIVLPLAIPGIVSAAIYAFINMWQEYMFASSMIIDPNNYTLTVGLGVFRGQRHTDWGALMATSVVIALPSLIMFSLIQKYFINNLAGGIKE